MLGPITMMELVSLIFVPMGGQAGTHDASNDIGHSKNEVVRISDRVWFIPHLGDQLTTASPSRLFIPMKTG